ncbi:MAG: DsbE family thiol:disulfide interchange protein [Polaromonas sp.]|nr:DsbE family thiol:disulfide interchange protein [Polaromonas sp.]
MKRYLLPLAVFAALVVFLAMGLKLDPRDVPSPLIGKPAPAFNLPRLDAPDQKISTQDLRGKVWVLNVWASWCAPCRVEHPLVGELAKSGVPVYGLNYKDKGADARAWLAKLGDPYVATLVDPDGLVGINYGVYGVPETFVIDQNGVIRFKFNGPITPEVLHGAITPLIRKLGG